jgi:hypothetical protein
MRRLKEVLYQLKVEAKKGGWNPRDICGALWWLLYLSLYRDRHDIVPGLFDVVKILDEEYYDICYDP